MPSGHLQIVVTVLAFALVMAMVAILKSGGVFRKKDAALFAKLRTQVLLGTVFATRYKCEGEMASTGTLVK